VRARAAAVNGPPVPAAKTVSATEDTPLNITGLLVGITDPDAGDTVFTLVNTSAPANGTISGLDAAAGQVTYTPAPGYFGPDSFVFTVADAAGATGSARVDITVGEWRVCVAAPLAVLVGGMPLLPHSVGTGRRRCACCGQTA
jgi:hypothetical protein